MRARRATCLACALLSVLSCSKGNDTRRAADGPSASKAPAPGAKTLTSTELEAGAAMVGRLVAATGGAEAIAAVRSVSVAGTMTRPLPDGRETSARVSTSVRFPDLYRQELTLPMGKITTIIGPSGAWILTGSGAPLPLPEERRLEIENIILRNPVALLKTRDSELFTAAAVDGMLQITVGSKACRITLDGRGLIDTMSYDLPAAKEALPPHVTVHFTDYRTAGPILYPFATTAEAAGTVTYRLKLGAVKVNESLPDPLFVPPRGAKQN